MATRISCATGNLSAAGTWKSTDAGGDQLTGGQVGAVLTSVGYSNNFTAGAVTVDGVLLNLVSINASPTGTMTVTLRNTTGGVDVATVTCNVSDLNADGNGWYCFTFTGVLLLAATSYAVGVVTSSSSQVSLLTSDAVSNWNTAYRTTTTGAPAAADRLFICGEITGAGAHNSYTVTQDQNSTTGYGATDVSAFATFAWSTSANTEFRLTGSSINLNVWSGGTLNMGTSGTRVASGSTAILSFNTASTGLILNAGATCNLYGNPVTTKQTYLTSDAASAQAVINVGAATSWANGDQLYVAGTAQALKQGEVMTISSISTLAITCTGNLSNAHNGTNSGGFDTRAEVMHLTRNVQIKPASLTSATFVRVLGGTFSADYAQFFSFGAVGTSRGVELVAGLTITASITNCSFTPGTTSSNTAFADVRSAGSLTFSNNNFAQTSTGTMTHITIVNTGGTTTADSNWLGGRVSGATGFNVSSPSAANTWTNVHVCDFATGINILNSAAIAINIDNAVVHSCSTAGIALAASTSNAPSATLYCVTGDSVRSFYNNTNLSISNHSNWKFSNWNSFGSFSQEITVNSSADNALMTSPTFDAGPTGRSGQSPAWINLGAVGSLFLDMTSPSIGASNAVGTVIVVAANGGRVQIRSWNNSSSSQSVNFVTQYNLSHNSQITFQHNGSAGTNVTYLRNGYIQRDTVHVDSGFTSCTNLVPTQNTTASETVPIRYYFPVASGVAKTVTIRAKKDGSYNGITPQVTINFLGSAITGPSNLSLTTSYADYTFTAGSGSITEDGTIEVVIECNGTAGNVYIQTVK